jgi:hypothetical protein
MEWEHQRNNNYIQNGWIELIKVKFLPELQQDEYTRANLMD